MGWWEALDYQKWIELCNYEGYKFIMDMDTSTFVRTEPAKPHLNMKNSCGCDWRLDLWVLFLVGAVLGTVIDCCKGGAWCHSWTQTCAKAASVLDRRTLRMSMRIKLRFWCAVDGLRNQTCYPASMLMRCL